MKSLIFVILCLIVSQLTQAQNNAQFSKFIQGVGESVNYNQIVVNPGATTFDIEGELVMYSRNSEASYINTYVYPDYSGSWSDNLAVDAISQERPVLLYDDFDFSDININTTSNIVISHGIANNDPTGWCDAWVGITW